MIRRVVARADDLWAGEMRAVRVDDLAVVLVNVDGEICAYEDRCPHRGVPLSEGRLEGAVLTCRAHEWSYDARSGCGLNPRSAVLRPLRVSLAGADVCIEIDRAPARVGPVLAAGTVADAVIGAIVRANAGVEVIDRGAYRRVTVPGSCRVSRSEIEAELGAAFHLPSDLERIMPSFSGRLRLTEEEVRWEAAER